jgi:hypothetical protein
MGREIFFIKRNSQLARGQWKRNSLAVKDEEMKSQKEEKQKRERLPIHSPAVLFQKVGAGLAQREIGSKLGDAERFAGKRIRRMAAEMLHDGGALVRLAGFRLCFISLEKRILILGSKENMTYHDGIDHNGETDVVNCPVGNFTPLQALCSCIFKDFAESRHFFIRLLFNNFPLSFIALRRKHLVTIPNQHRQHLLLQLPLLPQPLLLPIFPAVLFALQDNVRDCAERLVIRSGANLVRGQSVCEGAVKVANGELCLGEIVVGLHVLGREAEAGLAVGDDGFPVAELEAGHGAVGVERWIFGIGNDAGIMCETYIGDDYALRLGWGKVIQQLSYSSTRQHVYIYMH